MSTNLQGIQRKKSSRGFDVLPWRDAKVRLPPQGGLFTFQCPGHALSIHLENCIRCTAKEGDLMSQCSAIGDTISCDAP